MRINSLMKLAWSPRSVSLYLVDADTKGSNKGLSSRAQESCSLEHHSDLEIEFRSSGLHIFPRTLSIELLNGHYYGDVREAYVYPL